MAMGRERIERGGRSMTNDLKLKYVVEFEKKGDMVYISHLDLMTLFRRSMRRADLPFVLTKGFTPRVKISLPRALKLGVSSDSEEAWFWLTEKIGTEKFLSAINKQLPEGISILKAEVA